MENDIDKLIAAIRKIPGSKIITLATEEGQFKIDVTEKGFFGYHKSHEKLFRAKLMLKGGMTIRQFLPITFDGFPLKTLYGIYFDSGKWLPISKAEVEIAHTTDYKTGNPIVPSKDVMFADFPCEN